MHMKKIVNGGQNHRRKHILHSVINGELNGSAIWLSWWPKSSGRRAETILAKCADELSAVFKETIGRPNWSYVGEKISEEFPDTPKRSDLGSWIYHLVKRHREREQRDKNLPEWKPPDFLRPGIRRSRAAGRKHRSPK
jgi:hypothetical protein